MDGMKVEEGKFELVPTWGELVIDIEAAVGAVVKSLEKMQDQAERYWKSIHLICSEASLRIFRRMYNLPNTKLSKVDTKRRASLYMARIRGQWYWNDKRGVHRETVANLRKCPLPRRRHGR